MTTYRLGAAGIVGALLPVLLGAFVGAVGVDAALRAGGPVAWVLLLLGLGWTLIWLRLPWAVRLTGDGPDARITFLAPLRRTTMPVTAIEAISGRWTGGMNRWFLASVWVDIQDRTIGLPMPVGFPDPEAVREHLLRLNPTIRMDR